MDTAKIRLSPEEATLINRTDWILTKNNIVGKVKQLLSELQSRQQLVLQSFSRLPHALTGSSPKISKGENYKGLPWLVLDYPRLFDKESFLAIRTLFWWGNFFSTTLHVSGRYKDEFFGKILRSYTHLQTNKFCVCVNKDEWQHHFENDNYRSIEEMDLSAFETLTRHHSFIKLAKRLSLEEWNDAETKLADTFTQLVRILQD